jgi:uncharacterized coiled-coil protein SlyX
MTASDARLVDLECRLAFLEKALEDQQRLVAAQTLAQTRLEERLEALVRTVREQRGNDVGAQEDEPPPPHH